VIFCAAAFAGPELGFAARTRPAGAAVLAAYYGTVADQQNVKTDLGGAFDVYFFWYEADARARASLLGGAIVVSGSGGVEPGFYVRDDAREDPRAFAVRPIGRAQVELNLRNDLAWLYARSNVLARYHPFPEWDPFRYVAFEGTEVTHENAVAAMLSPSGTAVRKLWFYFEFIGQDSWGPGVIDRNIRLGVIGEKMSDSVSFDVDGYWSFMNNGLGGPGLFGILYWVPPPKNRDPG
jgi:hypothetical protein